MIELTMGLFAKKERDHEEEIDNSDTIDAYELLALNQEAARKEKLARKALMDKEFTDEDVQEIEFEATTTIKNIGDLLNKLDKDVKWVQKNYF